MIVLRLENWPDGDATRATRIGEARISNLSSADENGETANYEVEIFEGDTQIIKSWVDAHKRKHGAWELVRAAFNAINSRIRSAEELKKDPP